MKYSADQIANIRSLLNISQEAFAKSIGYSRSYVKDIESGRVKPSRAFLEALTSKYGVSADAMLSGFGLQINAGLHANFLTSEGGFIYLYDFTDLGLDMAEQELIKFFVDTGKKFIIIDGREIKGFREFFNKLSESQKLDRNLPFGVSFIQQCTWNLDFIVLKRFSESSIKGKAWRIYIDLHSHCRPAGLIVLDKPSYLEKYAEYLYHRAFPIHFKDTFGFAHRPS
jgi:transcriptional regulator with XRE-family HTH domain